MTKFGVILFVVYLKTSIITVSSRSTDTAMFYQTNDKIIQIIDDLLISLKVSKHFTKSKRAELYISRYQLVEVAIRNNHKAYKKLRDISKTKISNKMAYFISNINEVIEGMIRSEAVRKRVDIRNDVNISTFDDESVKHFVTLASRFNLKLKTLASRITVPKLKRSKDNSQEEARRIYAGSSTGIARYPFMVSVHVAGRFMCAGSLLHESLALSAASCLMSSVHTKPRIQIRVASDYVSKMGSLVNIEELIFHPEFNRASLANNLVLLQTKKALRFRKQLVVAIQYDRGASSVLRSDVEDLVILGWGRRRMDAIDVHDEDRPLSEGHLQLYEFETCQYIYTSAFVTDRSFCAGFVDRGSGACNHDGGGPALVDNVLVGVISFGSSRCGAADAPTVFSRLGLYAEWIDGVLQKYEESQGINPKEHISENMSKEEVTDLEQAMKDVYKENFNVDEVLYGPIETLYDDETTNMSMKLTLRDFPTDPNMFPNPELVANIASPKTLKPIEPPEGYWKDSSIEQTTPKEDHKLPADRFSNDTFSLLYSNLYSTLHQVFTEKTDINNLQDIYADSEEKVKSTAKVTEDASYVNEINVKPHMYDPKNTLYEESSQEEPDRTSKGSTHRENVYNAVISTSDPVRYTRLFKISSKNSMTYKPKKVKQSSKAKIENGKVNEKAVIVMSDSGTTQRIEVYKDNPLYQQGFKMLAAKILRRKEQI